MSYRQPCCRSWEAACPRFSWSMTRDRRPNAARLAWASSARWSPRRCSKTASIDIRKPVIASYPLRPRQPRPRRLRQHRRPPRHAPRKNCRTGSRPNAIALAWASPARWLPHRCSKLALPKPRSRQRRPVSRRRNNRSPTGRHCGGCRVSRLHQRQFRRRFRPGLSVLRYVCCLAALSLRLSSRHDDQAQGPA